MSEFEEEKPRLTVRGFINCFEWFYDPKKPKYKAYRLAESWHKKRYGFRRFASYDSFRLTYRDFVRRNKQKGTYPG